MTYFHWDMTVKVLDVLDELVSALPRGSDAQKAADTLISELTKLDRTAHVEVEAETEVNNLEAVDIISDMLDAVEDPAGFLRAKLRDVDPDEESIKELILKLAKACHTGATISPVWRDEVHREIAFSCPELLR